MAFNVKDYHQADLFARIEPTEDPDITLYDVSHSKVTFFHALFSMYGCDYCRNTLFVTFHPGVYTKDVITHSTGGITVGH